MTVVKWIALTKSCVVRMPGYKEKLSAQANAWRGYE